MANPLAKWFLLAFAATATFAASAPGDVNKSAQLRKGQVDEKNKDELAKGQTVILGTWTWNIEKNSQGGREDADVFWEQVTDKEQFLVPKGQAGLMVLEKKGFEKVTPEDLKGLKYSDKPLANTSLTPGTVFALRTNQGNFAKLKVVQYRELHDFSFPEANLLEPRWREFVLQKPNTKNYHLEVEWILYRKPGN